MYIFRSRLDSKIDQDMMMLLMQTTFRYFLIFYDFFADLRAVCRVLLEYEVEVCDGVRPAGEDKCAVLGVEREQGHVDLEEKKRNILTNLFYFPFNATIKTVPKQTNLPQTSILSFPFSSAVSL